MKVWLGKVDEAGCGHYRIKYPADAVSGLGHDVTIVDSVQIRHRTDGKRVWVCEVAVPEDVDVFVMQRPLKRTNLEMIEPLQKLGVAVVVDVDDDFSCIDPKHSLWANMQPPSKRIEGNAKSNRLILAEACAKADLVTVTTPALARRYGAHGRVVVLPNCVPAAMTTVGELVQYDDQPRTIGWPGFVATHPNDLQVTRGGVAQAVRENEVRFLNIGTGTGVAPALGLLPHEVEATGPIEFVDYPYECARLDVGIVPLAETAFNEAKSGLKGLELAAVGVPFVASPTTEYRRLAVEGIGITAKSRGRSWASAIKRLLGEEGVESAERALAAVRQDHTYEVNGWRWAEAWEQARVNRGAHVEAVM